MMNFDHKLKLAKSLEEKIINDNWYEAVKTMLLASASADTTGEVWAKVLPGECKTLKPIFEKILSTKKVTSEQSESIRKASKFGQLHCLRALQNEINLLEKIFPERKVNKPS